tara:strand:+ start:813 stop:1334 length:522 start_codon:yes stop_codon:yes gene_type:complete
MTYPLGFSEIHEVEHLSKKLKSIPKKEVQEIEQLRDDPDDEALAGDFVPPPKALSAKQLYKDEMSDGNSNLKTRVQEGMRSDPPVSQAVYNQINNSEWSEDYYKQYIPSYTNTSEATTDDYLSKKINYMIHLLEEQQDIKQGSTTEELVLYCFLGVFVIYLVDSFVKVGKYIR